MVDRWVVWKAVLLVHTLVAPKVVWKDVDLADELAETTGCY